MAFSVLLRHISSNLKSKLTRSLCTRPDSSTENFADDQVADNVHEIPQSSIRRGLPITVSEYKARKHAKPQLPLNPHLLKVSILGEPNVGKSTLTNALVKWKVCAVSKKVHTTRKKAAAIFVEDEKQIVFLDTPGFITPEHSKKHRLEVSLVVDPEKSVRECDLIAVIVDAANKWTNKRIHEDILEILNKFREKTSILILNKVDIQKNKLEVLNISRALTRGAINGVPLKYKEKELKKKVDKLEEMIRRTEDRLSTRQESSQTESEEGMEHFQGATGWPFFSAVFMVSALKESGIDNLRSYFLQSAKPGDWLYHHTSVTDNHPYEIAISIVRQFLLEDLSNEIPYTLQLSVKKWEVTALGAITIEIHIACPHPHYKKIVIGKAGRRMEKLVENSRQALQDAFRCEIYFKLAVV